MNYISQIILMAVLIVCSAFFSGSETAFFNISPRRKKSFRDSGNKLYQTAADLLEKPHQLLTSLLLGNMAANVLYFAISSSLSVRIGTEQGAVWAIITAVGAFFALLLFGEMLPKSFAFYYSKNICIAVSPLCMLNTKVLSPVVRMFETFVITPLMRLLAGNPASVKQNGEITVNQFKLLVESSRQQGLISSDENDLLGEIMELSLLKVRHVMTPRVDMIAAEIALPPNELRSLMNENSLTKIPVYKDKIDNIVGMVSLRDLILNPDTKLNDQISKADFIPEQKNIESLLEFFRTNYTDTAIVVDEYGGIAGMISLEDCVEEIVGPIETGGQVDPIEQIGPLEYRLAGNLAIHDWTEVFGIEITNSRVTTIAGLTAALLGKVPKPGDSAYLKNLKLTVENMHKHRIQSLILTFKQKESDEK